MNIRKVLDGDYCVGCGACTLVQSGKMKLNEFGEFKPFFDETNNPEELDAVCPFLSPKLNEDTLAKNLFHEHAKYNKFIGYNIKSYAGYIKSENIRENGTSGGFGTWIGLKLLSEGLIDGVIHARKVDPAANDGIFFDYKISRTPKEISDGSKTRYHVLEISKVMNQVRQKEGRYLFIGVPCFVKAVRRLQKIDSIINSRIVFCVSLVCGHYKSVNWTRSLAWGAGLNPQKLKEVEYRVKGPKIDTRSYVFRGISNDGDSVQKDTALILGGKFNAGAMMLNACNYCDDVVGETSDLTVGDAWIPKYDTDRQGTNLLIVRNVELHQILLKAKIEEEIFIEEISTEEAISSQSGGFRQRREGLAYRLQKKKKEGQWVPKKRIAFEEFKIKWLRRIIYRQRLKVSLLSKKAFKNALEQADYQIYRKALRFHFLYLKIIETIASLRKILLIKTKRTLSKTGKLIKLGR